MSLPQLLISTTFKSTQALDTHPLCPILPSSLLTVPALKPSMTHTNYSGIFLDFFSPTSF